MALYDYSLVPQDAASKAQAYDLDASYKDLTQVCGAIRRKLVPEARTILEKCISMEHAIPYRKFCKGMGHRSELGGLRGRYPRKEARMVLAVLDNAAANASNKGLKPEELLVAHAAAYKQNVLPRYRHHWAGGSTLGYGKQNVFANYVTARLELVLAPAPKELLERKGKKRASGKAAKAVAKAPAKSAEERRG